MQASPAFEAVPSPHLDGVIAPGKFIRWETQRGCPFACSFCQHRKKEGGVGALSSERIAAEIRLFCQQSPDADINVLDPTFNTSTAHAVAILDAFHAHTFTGRLSLQVRPEKITPAFLDAAARLGPGRVTLEMGVQTAVAKELDEIGRVAGACSERSLRKVGEKLDLVRAYGLDAEVSLMFALPHQSVESLRESVGWYNP